MALITEQAGPVADVAVELLARQLVLPMTVTRVPGSNFSGRAGDTITVPVPQPRSALTQNTPSADITFEEANEVPVDVTVSHLYNGHLLSDEEATLEVVDFGRQITFPQVESVARGAENLLAAAMNGLAADLEFAATASAVDTDAVIIAAIEALDEADAPFDNRYLAVSPSIRSRILAVDKFTRVDASGSSSALRSAVIGDIYGLTVVVSNGLTTDTAVAYHKSGFVFANRAPVAPRGAASSSTANRGGIAMRQIFDYIPTKLSDASVVSTFAGASAVADNESANTLDDFPRSVKIEVGSS